MDQYGSSAASDSQENDWLEGDTRLRKGLGAIFVKNVPGQMRKLRDAMAQNDVRNAELHSHSIKGAAAMIGAPGLRDAAQRVEQACAQDNLGEAAEQYRGMETEFQKVMETLKLEQERKED